MPDAGAPPSSRQPAPVPEAPRQDGAPYATPWVRRLAQARGIDLARLKPGTNQRRVLAADLDRPEAPTPAPVQLFLTTQADVTEALQAAARRGGALLATVSAAFADMINRIDPHTRTVDLAVSGTPHAATVVLPSAEHISVNGIHRKLSSHHHNRPTDDVPFSILNLGGTGILGGDTRLSGHQKGALTLGEVNRSVNSRIEAAGTEAICHRSTVTLTLTYDPGQLEPAHAAAILSGVKALLEDPD